MKKNVAVKFELSIHTQLGVLAKLEGKQIPDIVRQAVEAHLDAKRAELAARSADVLAAIDQEAETRRAAVAALVGSAPASEQPKLEVVGNQLKGRSRRAEPTDS